MLKIIIFFSFLLVLTNCAAPGFSLFGPAVTGITTKSTARSTISFGTNQIMKNFKNKFNDKKIKKIFNFKN